MNTNEELELLNNLQRSGYSVEQRISQILSLKQMEMWMAEHPNQPLPN